MTHHDKPHFQPSEEVHIRPTRSSSGTTAQWGGPDHWITEGFELRDLISMLYGFATTRIEFLVVDPDTRYDIALVLPHEEDEAMLLVRIRKALERELHLAISKVTTSRAVCVVEAPNGPGSELVPAGTVGSVFQSTHTLSTLPGRAIPSKEEIQEILNRREIGAFVDAFSMASGTISDLCSILESSLGMPVIDESRLQGYFEAHFMRHKMTKGQIFDQFREAFGLVITAGVRDVESLRVQGS